MRRRMLTAPILALALAIGSAVPAAAADHTVSGTVTLGGKTAGQGVVVAWYAPVAGGYGTTTTTSAGTYTLDVPGDVTDWVLVANLDLEDGSQVRKGYAPEFVGAGGESDYLWQSLGLRRPLTTDVTVDVDVAATGTVTGRLPGDFAGTTVHIGGPSAAAETRYVKVASDGTYRFTNLTPGRYRVTTGYGQDGYLPYRSAVVTVPPGKTVSVTTPAVVGGILTGKVVVDGVAQARVSVTARGQATTTTDSRGVFRFDGLRTGTYPISVATWSAGGDSPSRLGSATVWVKVTAGSTATRNLVAYRKGGVEYPFSAFSALVTLEGTKVMAGPEMWAKPGTYWLYVKEGGRWDRKQVTLTAGKLVSVPHIPPGRELVTISGTVEGGDPAGTRKVAACDVLCDWYPRTATVGSDGRYKISGLVGGAEVDLRVSQDGWSSTIVTPRVTSGDTVNLAVGPQLGGLRGALTLRGVGVTGWMSLNAPGSTGNCQARLVNGTFRTPQDFPAGRATLTLSSTGPFLGQEGQPFWYALPADVDLTVRPGEITNVGAIEGRVGR
jgi:hypothetical protein